MTTFLIIIILIVVVIAGLYNKLQKYSQPVKEAASNVQVAISKKITMLNQLVEVVKNYQEAEQFTLLKISQDSTDTAALIASYQQSGNLMSSIQGIADRFPNLKASDQYQKLMSSISSCEDNIQSNRERYNHVVKEYNSGRSSIPTVFVAQFLGFSEAPYIQFDIAGNAGDNILKGFQTDDGQRLNILLKQAGDKVSSATKSLANHAGNAGKLIADKIREMPSDKFFYMVPGSVPKGPLALDEIESMVESGTIPADTKIAASGSEEWQTIDLAKRQHS